MQFNPGFDTPTPEASQKKGGITSIFKSIKGATLGKISGKPVMSEKALFAEIKSFERKLKTVD